MKEFTLAIVGIDFPNTDRARTNRRSELMLLEPGDPLTLLPEPTNRFDPRAVAVFSPNGVQVGYVTAERAALVGGRIRAGDEVSAIYQGIVGKAGYARVRFGGGMPTLPPVTFAPDYGNDRNPAESDGFWPDEPEPEWEA
jgi:hypothetical protein